MPNAFISGTGFYAPPRVVTNDDLREPYGHGYHARLDRSAYGHRRAALRRGGRGQRRSRRARRRSRRIKRAGLEKRDIELIDLLHALAGRTVSQARACSCSEAGLLRHGALRPCARHSQPVLRLPLRTLGSQCAWCARAPTSTCSGWVRDPLGGARPHDARPPGGLAVRGRRGRGGGERDRRAARHPERVPRAPTAASPKCSVRRSGTSPSGPSFRRMSTASARSRPR